MATIVGSPTETKPAEQRVGLSPAGAVELVRRGHEVVIEAGAGRGAGFADADYERQGARIVAEAQDVFEAASVIVKVKEPSSDEVSLLAPGQMLFTYLHLAAAPELAAGLCRSGATCIAYETLRDQRGRLPLLAPMSEIAGKLSVQAGAQALESASGGRGVLLGGATGVPGSRVVVIGAGVAGTAAAAVAAGVGARVRILDCDLERLREIERTPLGTHATTTYSSRVSLEASLEGADLVIGTVHVPGARTPRVVDVAMLELMAPRAAIVDVSIDQGGCFETSRPTTHDAPTYVDAGVVHYCVANMPGAVPVTATAALTNATLPRVVRLADGGVEGAFADAELRSGINVHGGEITNQAVADAIDLTQAELRPPVVASTAGERQHGPVRSPAPKRATA